MSFKRIGPSNINRDMQRKLRKLDPLPKEAHKHFVSITPIDKGNARRSTGFIQGNTIDAKYDYANRLNEGYSRQSPQGMTDPTIDFLRNKIRQILG